MDVLIRLTLGAALLVGLTGWCARADEAPRPNFVLLIGDDISSSDFGCYGHPTIRTPNIDRLAAGGLRFDNAYLTTSSCSPTRTSLITGRYPHNTGAPELHMDDSPHPGRLPQFPHLLREAGYFTAQAGKWHFNGDVTRSFEVRRRGGGHSGAKHWVSILRDRPKDRPFFLWYAAKDAHRPWDQALSQGPHGPEDVVVPPYHVDGPRTRRDLARYYDEVHRFDANVGRVVEELKRQGVYEDTVVIVIADNGRPFPRDKTWLYDSGIKTPLVIHWPAGLGRAAVAGSLVSVIDLPPTILELAGVDRPETFQGVSLRPILNEPQASVRDVVFAERNWHGQRYHERMVRHGEFVYIRNHLPRLIGFMLGGVNVLLADGSEQPAYTELVEQWRMGEAGAAQREVFAKPRPREMLFNVADDPHQLHNLADSPQHSRTLATLRRALGRWSEQTGDTVPATTDMTPDFWDRQTWGRVPDRPRRPPGTNDLPGQSTKAWTINHPGPIKLRSTP